MNEKRGPHYDLAKVKARIAAGGLACFTKSALDGIRQMGLTTGEALAAINALKRSDCYKSMTTYGDHTVWHDVYRAPTVQGTAYIKLVLDPKNGRVCISFKRL